MLERSDYDHGTLTTPPGTESAVRLEYEVARAVVDEVGRQFPKDVMFGVERNDSFRGILGAVEQTFAGQDLYPRVQEKAAHLLYVATAAKISSPRMRWRRSCSTAAAPSEHR